MTKQYVKITGPMANCTWEETEREGFNKTDKFEVKKIDFDEGYYFVVDPSGRSWWFSPSSVELVEGPIGDHSEDAKKGRDKFFNDMGVHPTDPLATTPNVPTFTEEELEHIREIMHERKNGPLVNCECDLSILGKLTPIPTKQPWGQAEFLGQLAKWGTMEGVEVSLNKKLWSEVYSISSCDFSTADDPMLFSDITHIRLNNGEPVECVKGKQAIKEIIC